MPTKTKVLNLDIRRRPDKPVGGALSINFQVTDQEKAEAFSQRVGATIRVAELYKQEPVLVSVARSIVADADAKDERAEWLKSAVGLNLDELQRDVESLGWTLRVTRRDGTASVCTRDYLPDRVNVEVEGEIVTRATFG